MKGPTLSLQFPKKPAVVMGLLTVLDQYGHLFEGGLGGIQISYLKRPTGKSVKIRQRYKPKVDIGKQAYLLLVPPLKPKGIALYEGRPGAPFLLNATY